MVHWSKFSDKPHGSYTLPLNFFSAYAKRQQIAQKRKDSMSIGGAACDTCQKIRKPAHLEKMGEVYQELQRRKAEQLGVDSPLFWARARGNVPRNCADDAHRRFEEDSRFYDISQYLKNKPSAHSPCETTSTTAATAVKTDSPPSPSDTKVEPLNSNTFMMGEGDDLLRHHRQGLLPSSPPQSPYLRNRIASSRDSLIIAGTAMNATREGDEGNSVVQRLRFSDPEDTEDEEDKITRKRKRRKLNGCCCRC